MRGIQRAPFDKLYLGLLTLGSHPSKDELGLLTGLQIEFRRYVYGLLFDCNARVQRHRRAAIVIREERSTPIGAHLKPVRRFPIVEARLTKHTKIHISSDY